MGEPAVFQLTDPITTHDGTVSELKLKTPTARAFIKYGMPYTVVREGGDDDALKIEFRFIPKAMFAFLADMSGVGQEHLEDINGVDVQPLFWKIVGILGDRPTKSST